MRKKKFLMSFNGSSHYIRKFGAILISFVDEKNKDPINTDSFDGLYKVFENNLAHITEELTK